MDKKRMAAAARDVRPVIADLVSAGRSVSWVEDELCRRLGQVLAAQDAADDARRAAGAREILESYSPDQLAEALIDAVVLAASQTGAAAGELVERDGLGRLLCALARIVPYPAAETPQQAVEDLPDRAALLSAASAETSPTGSALWCRNVYGTRFAITAPFAGADGPDRWYLWDVDACGDRAYTVGAGYFADADQALASWREAVGLETSAEAVLEPVSDPRLAELLLPGPPDFFHPGGESEAQYAEFHRSRRLAQELRHTDFLDGIAGKSKAASAVRAQPVDKNTWIAEFAAWRAEQRPGADAVSVSYSVGDGDGPLTEAELYRELADSWCSSELPELSYGCSPHRIALRAAAIRDFYTDDFAAALLGLVPDVAAWLTERAGLAVWHRGRVLSYAEGASSLEVDLGFRADSDLAALHE
ncbi:hypothetical protein [Streptomyces chiangmaiensis]|uniref:Uncharacterized protein n=1 Tax=Streptomyces chiangmaiensis TaxID=766497 RepID=A0ABU7FZ24_9ACTN|nr:hypothetical protein [Streptomyces chiangmaiensis]MED7828369.1 hypothetical protein [Streptomyces chiangmaiensis]